MNVGISHASLVAHRNMRKQKIIPQPNFEQSPNGLRVRTLHTLHAKREALTKLDAANGQLQRLRQELRKMEQENALVQQKV